ncbi:hypothetical protein [Bradyrhizobium sp.]
MAINEKGDAVIIHNLRIALDRRRADDVPAFNRGRMIFDFELGKVRIETT